MALWTVLGYWAETGERYGVFHDAASARAAEDDAQRVAHEKGGMLRVCRVIEGAVATADRYTAFLDPADPRNDEASDLEPDVPGVTDDEWTVFGVAVPRGTDPAGDLVCVSGERYGDIVNSTSALAAEDVARSRLADKGGELLVCAVLAGPVVAADTYATFVNPDVRAS